MASDNHHVQKRANQRMRDTAGLSPTSVNRLTAFSESLAKLSKHESEAFHITNLPGHVQSNDSSLSNGNQVWGIARNKELRTIMLRRDNQPPTAEALRVAKVTRLRADDVWNHLQLHEEGTPRPARPKKDQG